MVRLCRCKLKDLCVIGEKNVEFCRKVFGNDDRI